MFNILFKNNTFGYYSSKSDTVLENFFCITFVLFALKICFALEVTVQPGASGSHL
jgi:hypothetical protein